MIDVVDSNCSKQQHLLHKVAIPANALTLFIDRLGSLSAVMLGDSNSCWCEETSALAETGITFHVSA